MSCTRSWRYSINIITMQLKGSHLVEAGLKNEPSREWVTDMAPSLA